MGNVIGIIIGNLAGIELGRICTDHVIPVIKQTVKSILEQKENNESN